MTKIPKMETNILELVILMVACLAPMIVLAHELDGDEFVKATSGVTLAGMIACVMGGYKLWKHK